MKNDFPIIEREKKGTRYLQLDTSKTTFRHLRWEELGDWGKRKCENMIFLSNQNKERNYIKIHYVQAIT